MKIPMREFVGFQTQKICIVFRSCLKSLILDLYKVHGQQGAGADSATKKFYSLQPRNRTLTYQTGGE